MGNRASLQNEEIKYISEETGFTATQVEALYARFANLDKGGNGSLGREDFLRVPELAINPLCERIVHMFFADCDEDHERINFRQFMKILAMFKPITRHRKKVRSPSQHEVSHHIFGFDGYRRHIRHSSLDGFLNQQPYEHYTTNQHNIHYVASATHLNSKNLKYDNFKKPLAIDSEDPNSRKRVLLFMFKVYDINNDDLISLDDLKALLKMMVGNYITEENLKVLAQNALQKADKDNDGYIDFDEFCNFFLDRDVDSTIKVKFLIKTSKTG